MGALKHPSQIDVGRRRFAVRVSKDAPKFLGFDIETNHLTGEPMLMHTSDGARVFGPHHGIDRRAQKLARFLRQTAFAGVDLVHWTAFDRILLFRALFDANPQSRVIQEYARMEIREIFSVGNTVMDFTAFKTGATVTIRERDSKSQGTKLSLYNAKQFYYTNLLDSTRDIGYPYEKGARDVHLINWSRYASSEEYRERVDKSNVDDARAALALSLNVSESFHEAFNRYPTSYFSAGGLAKSALQSRLPAPEYESLAWKTYLADSLDSDFDTWDLWCASHEAYSGGLIDSYRLGNAGDAWIADVAACYPAIIRHLPDLRGSRLIRGTGPPPYKATLGPQGAIDVLCFTRGTVTIPENSYHTVSYRNFPNDSKSRRYGTARYTYTLPERELLLSDGATFRDEEWIAIECVGNVSPLGVVVDTLLIERDEVRGTSAERRMKDAINSLYGVTYELNPVHEVQFDGAIKLTGYKAGELYNPILAAHITAYARCNLAYAARHITKKNGQVCSLMTDSVSWIGPENAIPESFTIGGIAGGVAPKKTVGLFDPPERISEYLCLGVGRYSYLTNSKLTQKHRGYRFGDPDSENDVDERPSNLWAAMRRAVSRGEKELDLFGTYLMSPGLVRARSKSLGEYGLGQVVTMPRKLNPLHLGQKRFVDPQTPLARLLQESVPTYQLKVPPNSDNTLRHLREGYRPGVVQERRKNTLARHQRHDTKRRGYDFQPPLA